jgi:voltage-dependent calcium channel T type alpha-1G
VNIVFSGIFGMELFFKLIALNIKDFVKDRFNIFDAFVVIVSFIEIIVAQDGGGSSFGALRAFRLFRLFKLFKVGDLRVLLESITSTISSMGNYIVLLFLFMYIESLLGM